MKGLESTVRRLGLQKGGPGQMFLSSELARRSDKYTPFLTGYLAHGSKRIQPGKIIYSAPYARKQWHTNRGRGLRGKMWCIRCWNAEGNEIIGSLKKYIAGGS